MDHKRFARSVTVKAASSGSFSALFSTEDEDEVGDVILSSAFEPGASAPVLWGHDPIRIIGKGTIGRVPRGATITGRFFTETAEGADKHKLVRAMGPHQRWSFAFQATDWDRRAGGGKLVKRLRVFEVSPVAVPANPYTQTLAISEKAMTSSVTLYEVVNAAVAVPDRLRRAADRAAEEARAALDYPFWFIPKWCAPAPPGADWRSSEVQRVHGPSGVAAFYLRAYAGSLFLKVDPSLTAWQVGWGVCHEAAHAAQHHFGLKSDEREADRFAYALMDSLQGEDYPWAR